MVEDKNFWRGLPEIPKSNENEIPKSNAFSNCTKVSRIFGKAGVDMVINLPLQRFWHITSGVRLSNLSPQAVVLLFQDTVVAFNGLGENDQFWLFSREKGAIF